MSQLPLIKKLPAAKQQKVALVNMETQASHWRSEKKHKITSLQRHGEVHYTNRKKAFATTQKHRGCKCGFQAPKALQTMKEKYVEEKYGKGYIKSFQKNFSKK